MSDVITTSEPTTDAPKATKKPRKPVALSNVHVRFAAKKGIDTTRAAKLNRSFIRSNFEPLCKVWPELRNSQKQNRDGNRYPATVPAKVADMIVNRSIAK